MREGILWSVHTSKKSIYLLYRGLHHNGGDSVICKNSLEGEKGGQKSNENASAQGPEGDSEKARNRGSLPSHPGKNTVKEPWKKGSSEKRQEGIT